MYFVFDMAFKNCVIIYCDFINFYCGIQFDTMFLILMNISFCGSNQQRIKFTKIGIHKKNDETSVTEIYKR